MLRVFSGEGCYVGCLNEEPLYLIGDEVKIQILDGHDKMYNFLNFDKFIDFIKEMTLISLKGYVNETSTEFIKERLLAVDDSPEYLHIIKQCFGFYFEE